MVAIRTVAAELDVNYWYQWCIEENGGCCDTCGTPFSTMQPYYNIASCFYRLCLKPVKYIGADDVIAIDGDGAIHEYRAKDKPKDVPPANKRGWKWWLK